MRKIKNSEIKEVAEIMTECFCDYPLYNIFFKDDEKKKKRVFYFFWYRIYTRRGYTYITEDRDLAVSYQKPEDPSGSSLGLWLNPMFAFGFFKNIPLKAIALVLEFGKMEEEYWKEFYNPLTDCYAQAICVLKESRGTSDLFKVLNELEDGRPIFCETHVEKNVELYKRMGLELCATHCWHGVNHYVMKKPGSVIKLHK